MKRMMGTVFAIENREAKDKYIYSNFKNTLSDSHSDSINYGSDIALRKLLVSMISVEIAKNMGGDHHASAEDLCYFMRKNDQETHEILLEFIRQLYQEIINMEKNKIE